MPYEPLHHKYRPQSFVQLVGQEAIATTLSNALSQQKIAPAYLFTGARGTGKTSSARIFAKSLNCLNADAPTPSPCGKCEACVAIAKGLALDVIEIDAASNTGVDNIRELIERSQFAPVQCRYKVYVIDECHMLSTAAFNALLKTLEEPPPRVVFVLATTDPQRVLPTIISRCQRFDFRRIELLAMVQHLGAIAQAENIPITAEALQLIAQIAQGGLRDAESLLDQLSLLEGEISVDKVWDLVGAVPEQDLLELVGAIAQDSPEHLLDQVRHLMNRGREPMIVLQNLGGFYRDLLIAKTAPQRGDLVSITASTWAAMREFVQSFELRWILEGQRYLRAAEVQIRNTTQPRMWLEVTLMGLLPSALAAAGESARAAHNPLPQKLRDSRSEAPDERPKPAAWPAKAATLPVEKPAVEPPVVPFASPAAENAVIPNAVVPSAVPVAPVEVAAVSEPVPPPIPVERPAVEKSPPPEVSVASEAGMAQSASSNLNQTWREVLVLLQPPSTQALLQQQCRLIGFDGAIARVGIKTKQLLNLAKGKVTNIEAAFSQHCGRAIRVSLEVLPAEAEADPATAPPQSPPTPSPSPAPKLPLNPSTEALAPSPEPAPLPPAVAQSPPISAPPPSRPPAPSPPAPPPVLSPAPPPSRWEEEDEVLRAARSFAQMFSGQIVKLEGEEVPTSNLEALALSEAEEIIATDADEDDEDVPF